jgi:hypothetical protein
MIEVNILLYLSTAARLLEFSSLKLSLLTIFYIVIHSMSNFRRKKVNFPLRLTKYHAMRTSCA